MVLNNLELNVASLKLSLSAGPLIETCLLVESHLGCSNWIPVVLHAKQSGGSTGYSVGNLALNSAQSGVNLVVLGVVSYVEGVSTSVLNSNHIVVLGVALVPSVVLNNLELNVASLKLSLSAGPLIETCLLVESHLGCSNWIPVVLHAKQSGRSTSYSVGVGSLGGKLIASDVVSTGILEECVAVNVEPLYAYSTIVQVLASIGNLEGYCIGAKLGNSKAIAIVAILGLNRVSDVVFAIASEASCTSQVGARCSLGEGDSGSSELIHVLVEGHVVVSVATPVHHVVVGAVGSLPYVNYCASVGEVGGSFYRNESDVVGINLTLNKWHAKHAS